jgi:hypothetical protein
VEEWHAMRDSHGESARFAARLLIKDLQNLELPARDEHEPKVGKAKPDK